MSAARMRRTSGGGIVTGAVVAIALGVGVMLGLASPRGTADGADLATTHAQGPSGVTDATLTDEWIAALSDAATSHRIDGMRIALFVTDGTAQESVDDVTAALDQGGAVVVTTARLGGAWWDPAKSTFRGELANQVAETVAGADGLGATDVLQHAIIQAVVPGAMPRGASDPAGEQGEGAADATQRQAVLLEVLSRAEVVTVDHPASDAVDAFVIVSGDGPEGAGAAVNATASVWEQYVTVTLEIFVPDAQAQAPERGTVMAEAVAKGADAPEATRPSVVGLSEKGLTAAQVVMALVEQAAGGTGVYAEAGDFALVAVP